MQTDSLFYRLFQTAPSLFFELIGQSGEQAQQYVFRSVELKQTAFRIDGVFLPASTLCEPTVYFVEVQFQRDEKLYGRLFAEVMLFLQQNPNMKAWHAVVLYGDRHCEPRDCRPYESILALPQVQRLYLSEFAETETESVEVGLVRLIVISQEQAIIQAKQLIEKTRSTTATSRLATSVIMEMIETIVVYKFPQMSRQEIETMFGLSELKQTRVYQEGREEGREEGERSLILRQLTRRFGSLPSIHQTKIQQMSLEQLEQLGEALLDFATIEDLAIWLQKSHFS